MPFNCTLEPLFRVDKFIEFYGLLYLAFDGLFCFISVFLDLGSLNLSMMKSNKLKRVRERKKREWSRHTGFAEKECICEIKERVGALVVLRREGAKERAIQWVYWF